LTTKSILIDLYKIKDPYTGLGQFSMNFARELAKRTHTGSWFKFLVPGNTPVVKADAQVKATALRRYLPFLNSGYDTWHSLHQFPAFLPARNTRHIITVHDLNFLREKEDAKAARYLKQLQQIVNRADVLTAISGYTREQMLQYLDVGKKEIHVIYNGVSLPEALPEKPGFIDSSKKFFLSIGVFKRAKNFHNLLPVMTHFPDYNLIIPGHNDTVYGKEVQAMAVSMGLDQRVILPGAVSDAQKLWLYRHCEAFLFPSLAEGFGLPVIEAMMCGKPVFLSNATCLPEIGGDAAFYFDDMTPETMAGTISGGLRIFNGDKALLSEKIQAHAATFSWERSIDGYLKVYGIGE